MFMEQLPQRKRKGGIIHESDQGSDVKSGDHSIRLQRSTYKSPRIHGGRERERERERVKEKAAIAISVEQREGQQTTL